MVNVLTEVTIDAPRHVVASYVADPAYATAWYKHVTAVEGPAPCTTATRREAPRLAARLVVAGMRRASRHDPLRLKSLLERA